jgi:uncharacterized membrane protein
MHEKVSLLSSRLFPLDALRGLIITLMALDHANYFIAQKHSLGEYWGGEFPSYSDPLAFLTRFVTHPCAPGFFFLMGVGMLLFANSRRRLGWSGWTVTRHFLIRGGLLIALQFFVENLAWALSPSGRQTSLYIGVLFALGGTMILASLLLWLKPKYLLVLTVALVLGTEMLTPDLSLWSKMHWEPINLLFFYPGGNGRLWSNYPVLPWFGLVTLGMLFGHWLVDSPKKGFEHALKLGGTFLLAFLVIRYLDGFGNIRPRMGNSWIDFLNVVKYPPSIAFTLLTMGINLTVLGLIAKTGGKAQRLFQPLVVFGQVPLFFYITHLFLYAGLGWLLTPHGTSIPMMYPLWLLGLVILFPLSLWYSQIKRRQPANSILRFF